MVAEHAVPQRTWGFLIGLLAQGGDGFFIGELGAEFGGEAKNISRKCLVQ